MSPNATRIRDAVANALTHYMAMNSPGPLSEYDMAEIAIGAMVAENKAIKGETPKPARIMEPILAPTDLGGDPKDIARAKGFSGNMCATCGGMNMRRSGTCEVCGDCGSTSGGCS